MRYTPPDRSSGRPRSDGASAVASGPGHNSTRDNPLDDSMPSRGKTVGMRGNNGAGVSAADVNRGHMSYGDPPGTPPLRTTLTTFDGEKTSVMNWERSGYESKDPSRQTPTGRPRDKEFDQFDGGFLSRDPFHQHERD